MIHTIVLDIGMVLVDFPWRKYLKSFGFPEEKEEKIIQAVFDNPNWNEFDRGVLTDEEIISLFCQCAPDCEREIRAVFAGPIEQMIEEYPFAASWVQELKAAGYQVLLLSNFGNTLFHRMKFGFLPYVDGGIISYRVKCMKPDPQIYHILMEQYGLAGEEILFLDDNPANIKAAAAEGWHTIWAPDHKTALAGLDAYGIVCRAGREDILYGNFRKETYTFEDLKEIIAALRSEHGCPWDKVQTHESLKGCMREEAYEVIEAIDELGEDVQGDHLREELGDVLLQVMMHSQIASEQQHFTVEDVVQGIAEKMVRRHPHVFGATSADTPEAALDTWEQAKEKENGKSGDPASEMNRVARALPALIRCQKVLKKGGLVTDTKTALERLTEDVQNTGKDPDDRQIGQLLADVVNLAASKKIPCEDALIKTIEKMIAEAQESGQK